MPIDTSYRESWNSSDMLRKLKVWTSRDEKGKVYGTRVGVHDLSCIGCMKCIDVCPTDVFSEFQGAEKLIVFPEKEKDCILCNACELVCPTDAISVLPEGGSQETLDSLLRGAPSDN